MDRDDKNEDFSRNTYHMFVIQTVLKNTMSKLSKTVSTVEKYQKLMILTQFEKIRIWTVRTVYGLL